MLKKCCRLSHSTPCWSYASVFGRDINLANSGSYEMVKSLVAFFQRICPVRLGGTNQDNLLQRLRNFGVEIRRFPVPLPTSIPVWYSCDKRVAQRKCICRLTTSLKRSGCIKTNSRLPAGSVNRDIPLLCQLLCCQSCL